MPGPAAAPADEPEDEVTDAQAPAPRARPTPAPRTNQPLESAEEQLAKGVSQAIAPLVARFAPWLAAAVLGGGGISAGWTASSKAEVAYEALTKKVDRLSEDLQATTKELAAAATRGQAERHEERIRDLEKAATTSVLERQQLRLELETFKRATPK